jgi:hypothetical protein
MYIRPVDLLVKWIVAHRDSHFEQSTFNGMLFSPDLVRRTRPHSVPRLSERGRARKHGRATVADIERSLFETYPRLFAEPADAGRFVAEVVTRYAE